MKMQPKDKYVVLQYDEVKIKRCYEYDKQNNQVLGPHSQMQVVMAVYFRIGSSQYISSLTQRCAKLFCLK